MKYRSWKGNVMANDKYTKRDMLTDSLELAEAAGSSELIAKLKHELELLDRKRSGGSVDAKRAAEVAENREKVIGVLANADTPMKSTAIANELGWTAQKATANLTALVKDNIVVRIPGEKKKDGVSFALAK